jgi:hypothetical protein
MIFPDNKEQLIFRQVGIPESLFTYLKDYQRAHHEQHGVWLNNSRCLALILAEHRQAALRGPLKSSGGAA